MSGTMLCLSLSLCFPISDAHWSFIQPRWSSLGAQVLTADTINSKKLWEGGNV